MSGENKSVSNADDQKASGDDQNKTQPKPINDVVSHETFKKLLGQKKNVEQENETLKRQLKEIEERKLQESGEWKKIAELKEQEALQAKQAAEEEKRRAENLNSTLIKSQKLQAVTEKLPGKLERPEYMAFIDVSKVVMNPETGEIDDTSVESVVQDFVKVHSKLLKSDPKFLPNGNAKPTTTLKYEDWLKLPVKEKRTRFKEVDFKKQ